jgi:hypothetical protein
MSRFLDGITENPLNIFDPASYSPVDPQAGSQGASRAAPATGIPGVDSALQSMTDMGRGLSQEGIAGLLDYQGMMDRQAAQRELASRFNVVPDGTAGIRTQNQVSEQQFEQIARQYSDIRRDRTDIHMDTSALATPEAQQQYRDQTMGLLADQLQTESGRALIGNLSNNTHTDAAGVAQHHSTTFAPRLDGHGNPDNTNAGEQPILADGSNANLTDARLGRTGAGGAGAGLDARIAFNPGAGNIQLRPGVEELRPDVAMYHEMMHAYTDTHGVTDLGNVQAGDVPAHGPAPTAAEQTGVAFDAGQGVARAEHQAAGLGMYANEAMSENAYRADRREIGWGDGTGVQPGDPSMWRRQQYIANNHVPGTETSPWQLFSPF